jgi:hypothetical protein
MRCSSFVGNNEILREALDPAQPKKAVELAVVSSRRHGEPRVVIGSAGTNKFQI